MYTSTYKASATFARTSPGSSTLFTPRDTLSFHLVNVTTVFSCLRINHVRRVPVLPSRARRTANVVVVGWQRDDDPTSGDRPMTWRNPGEPCTPRRFRYAVLYPVYLVEIIRRASVATYTKPSFLFLTKPTSHQ